MKLPRGARPYALIAAAVAAAYANATGAAFQFDDWNVIVNEPKVHGLAAWWASMPGIRPLLKLSYALNWAISPSPLGFHLVNVAIHAANACLVHALVAKRAAKPVALVTALIFALHPVQTEAVTYVTGRSVSLSALFAFAALAAARWASPLWFLGGLMVKETIAVTAILKRSLLPYLGLATIVALLMPTYRHLLDVSLSTRSIGTNLLTQAHGVTYLIGQLVRLDRVNADPKLPVIASWSWPVFSNAVLVLSLVAVGVVLLRKNKAVGLAILWFFLWLLPTNSILPRLDVANDRQLYVALLGPAFLAAYGLDALAKRRGNVFPWGAAIVLLLTLATATHLRNRVYIDEVGFWDDTAWKSPHNARAFNNLGYALAIDGRNDEADAAFSHALELDPAYVKAKVNLILLREGRLIGPDSKR
jgi:protein O-mannosyl-transferase